jgi:sodium/bile acid cotransporter 7
MASVLFAGQSLGLVVLPLMLFHQIQLMACAALARRFAAGPDGDSAGLVAGERSPNFV